MQGMIGKKLGMTRVTDAQGRQVPVTVVECGPCVVVQRKTLDRDGYEAVQLGFGEQKEQRMTKPALGVFKKNGMAPRRFLVEFGLDPVDAVKVGDVVTVEVFQGVGFVDVTGVSKGKGFQGVVRRHQMSGGPMTHGGHSKRRVGSVGCRELPGRIHKNKRMPGHMGTLRVTQQSLRLVQVRPEDNALLIHGAIPGSSGGIVLVRKSVKRGGNKP